jgi:hypothetical protein
VRFRLKRRYVIPVAAAAVLAVGGTAAYAATAVSPVSSGMINGCYTTAAINGSHVFFLQNAGTSCPKGTTPISWNQQGPSGPAGPSGQAGPAGPSGPARPPGPTVTVTVTATPTTSSTLTATPDNTCASSVGLGSLSSGNTVTGRGVNVGSSEAWYTVTFNSSVSSFTMDLTGTAASGVPAGTDVMSVYSDCAATTTFASDVTTYTGAAPGTYYVRVVEAGSGADGAFTLQTSAS